MCVCIYIYGKREGEREPNHFTVYLEINNIVNQLYFNKNVKTKKQ